MLGRPYVFPPFPRGPLTVNPEGLLVTAITRVYYKYRIPIIPYSGSSSLEGNFSAPFGGITKIGSGLFFPIDPSSVKVEGIIGTNYSGTNAVKYVVLADGTIIKIRRRPRKSSTGYNLNSLFIRSKGTLGLVTKATLKLSVIPEEFSVAVVTFPFIRDTVSAAAEIIDEKELPTLFFKFSGTKAGVKENISLFILTLRKDRDEVYKFRRYLSYTIPFSKLTDINEVSKKEIDELRLFASILGYIRDRNFYEKKVEIYVKNIVKRALEIKGICTSEYSIG
ncbi:hypothetical protein QBC39DRAFT_393655 [Podospora conica]|nr:hypothetical protein QBC39DRAFT_393655 [Schizothecium conicum]